MRKLSGSEIRRDFLRFFEGKGHRAVHSSSLVPANDPTLLFTNAGMNQFKDVFLGAERRDYSRAASSQKCVRAGGKHNDLENVGFTRRHHTFFEMLGNFSFGDYFKKDAIAYAWELLTSEEWFGIPAEKLYVTIFEGDGAVLRDDEAYRLWLEAGVPAERIFELGAKDNFWAMGDTGPCGPCSEIYFDLGLEASETGKDLPFGQDDQRYMEIWNLVFMQFDRGAGGVLTPLPKPSIDTGMGLERVSCVLQGVLSNYQTDLFIPLIARAAELVGFTVTPAAEAAVSDEKGAASLRIIADHARAATFLISDGVTPANDGRGYVLRKILRRGIRHGRLLGQERPFMHEMVYAVRNEMQAAYPELVENAERVSKTVLAEEEQFARVMDAGTTALQAELDAPARSRWVFLFSKLASESEDAKQVLRESIQERSIDHENTFSKMMPFFSAERIAEARRMEKLGRSLAYSKHFPGERAFYLYETYGLPKDFIADAARDAGLELDEAGFEAAKRKEQERARASWKGGSQKTASPVYRELARTEFEGYGALKVDGARVLALVRDGLGVRELKAGEEGEVVLDATSFYADSGGQVGDTGVLLATDHQTVVAEVRGCTKPVQGVFAHQVLVKQAIAVGDGVATSVDGVRRAAITRNHTGTHLLHAALREVLGKHVKQAGSLVSPGRLRFDFSHFTGVAEEELAEIEAIVNRQVLANARVETKVDVPIDVAVEQMGAMALFGEKYGDRVRVVEIGGPRAEGGFSTELCGGVHVGATGEIGLVKITGESAVASGVRRVEAITGAASLAAYRRDYEVARVAARELGLGEATPEAMRERLEAQEEEMKRLRRELEQLRMKAAAGAVGDAVAAAVDVAGFKLLARRVDGLEKGQMRELVDQLRGKLGSGVVVLGAASADGKVTLIAGVTKDLVGRVQAGKLVGLLAAQVGGKGGGRPDLAEAGGTDVGALDGVIGRVAEVVRELV